MENKNILENIKIFYPIIYNSFIQYKMNQLYSIPEIFEIIYTYLPNQDKYKFKNCSKYIYELFWFGNFDKTIYFSSNENYQLFKKWQKNKPNLYITHYYFFSTFKGQVGKILKSVKKITITDSYVQNIDIEHLVIEDCRKCIGQTWSKKHWNKLPEFPKKLQKLEINSQNFFQKKYDAFISCSFYSIQIKKLILSNLFKDFWTINNRLNIYNYYLKFSGLFPCPQKIILKDPINSLEKLKLAILTLDERVLKFIINIDFDLDPICLNIDENVKNIIWKRFKTFKIMKNNNCIFNNKKIEI